MTWYYGVGIGIGAAALRFALGWLKAGEPWEGVKMLRTLGIAILEGGAIGGLADLGVKELFIAVFAGTIVLEEAILGVKRQIETARG